MTSETLSAVAAHTRTSAKRSRLRCQLSCDRVDASPEETIWRLRYESIFTLTASCHREHQGIWRWVSTESLPCFNQWPHLLRHWDRITTRL